MSRGTTYVRELVPILARTHPAFRRGRGPKSEEGVRRVGDLEDALRETAVARRALLRSQAALEAAIESMRSVVGDEQEVSTRPGSPDRPSSPGSL